MHEREGEMMSLWSPGHRIREPGLQNLFGMHRNRFPKNLPAKEDGRETWYDYRAVVKIMRALLLEKPGKAKAQPDCGSEVILFFGHACSAESQRG